jgi:hypothetical protein
MNRIIRRIIVSSLMVFVASPVALHAHCDTREGPVVLAAQEALKKGAVTPVLKWVKAADEDAIRAAFDKTVAVRRQSKEAAELADTWFFETLVRIHRAGEGAPYTGLKSGVAEEPGIVAADHALDSGKVDDVLAQTAVPLQAALTVKFERVRALKSHADHSVEAGREYVEAYVDYVHFAERLALLAVGSPNAPQTEHGH